MSDSGDSGKPYDLEERTFLFAKEVRAFVKLLPRSISNEEDVRQLVRATGSVGANYIEANEALGKKDFLMRLRISRKECKESRYCRRLIEVGTDAEVSEKRESLVAEANEILKILSSIINKSVG